jgi:D-erythronate 2-dehydrogenase
MHVIITGGSGFLGARLARSLLSKGSLALAGESATAITTLTLTDQIAPPDDLKNDPRVRFVGGDLNDLLLKKQLLTTDTALIFHLAAAVSGECEADFDLGMRSNFEATRALLEGCRALKTKPVFIFASSLAVFGNPPGFSLPALIEDSTLPTPQSSYGIQKFIGEQLVADFARKGFITGRNVRLMTVSVRPGKPNGAASSFLSGMIREPLAEVKAVCPVPAQTPIALSSPTRTIEGLIVAAETSTLRWGPLTAINFPALSTTPSDMARALEKVAGKTATDLIDWTPDPAIERLVNTWPGKIAATRAHALGLKADESFEAIIREYIRENPSAVKI